MRCGHELNIEGNFMLSDFYEGVLGVGLDVGLDKNNDAMVTFAYCPNCGAKYEITDTPENDKVNFPYWVV